MRTCILLADLLLLLVPLASGPFVAMFLWLLFSWCMPTSEAEKRWGWADASCTFRNWFLLLNACYPFYDGGALLMLPLLSSDSGTGDAICSRFICASTRWWCCCSTAAADENKGDEDKQWNANIAKCWRLSKEEQHFAAERLFFHNNALRTFGI